MRDRLRPENKINSAEEAPNPQNAERGLTVPGILAKNSEKVSELQALVNKMFASKNKGEMHWGWDVDRFRKIFTEALPEELKKLPAYKKAVRGLTGEQFAQFARGFTESMQQSLREASVRQSQNEQANVEAGGLGAISPDARPATRGNTFDFNAQHEKIQSKKDEVIGKILEKFGDQKSRMQFVYSDEITQIAREANLIPSQAVRFLYEHYGINNDEFNKIRKNLKVPKTADGRKLLTTEEQMLLRELCNILDSSRMQMPTGKSIERSRAQSDYFISTPKPNGKRQMYVDYFPIERQINGHSQESPRFRVNLPLKADIGEAESLYLAALELIQKGNFASMPIPKDKRGLQDAFTLSEKKLEQTWWNNLAPAEQERLTKRREFIEKAKSEFDSSPESFIMEKFKDYAQDIPLKEAVRYLADESLIGEARIKQYKRFSELFSGSDENLKKFISERISGQTGEEILNANLNREQLLLTAIRLLIIEAREKEGENRQRRLDESSKPNTTEPPTDEAFLIDWQEVADRDSDTKTETDSLIESQPKNHEAEAKTGSSELEIPEISDEEKEKLEQNPRYQKLKAVHKEKFRTSEVEPGQVVSKNRERKINWAFEAWWELQIDRIYFEFKRKGLL